MIRLEPFAPRETLPKLLDPSSGEILAPRNTTTDEQELEAIHHALEAMRAADDWTAELEVRWTRGKPTRLTVHGHPEHFQRQVVPVFDRIEEGTLEGAPIAWTVVDRFHRLMTELEQQQPVEGL